MSFRVSLTVADGNTIIEPDGNRVRPAGVFDRLTPDVILRAAETALEIPFTGYTAPLPSYINRVYELQAEDGTRYIVKFYRPGRWSREGLEDEHCFVRDCVEDEIPVIAPLELRTGGTLATTEGITFSLYPKRYGRQFEANDDEAWVRIGRLLGRLHTTGARREAPARITLHPCTSTAADLRELVEGGFVPPGHLPAFKEVTDQILTEITPLFDGVDMLRTHGDCHWGNLIFRPDEGIFVIDFDDMMTAPPVQDIWMLLPGLLDDSRRELNLILEGYEDFRTFDMRTLRLIEPLRVMRMIYFLAWCTRQVNDYQFRHLYPDWGSPAFWAGEIPTLAQQLQIIRETCRAN